MVEQLIADISKQLSNHMDRLNEFVAEVEGAIDEGEEIPANTEERIERAAAGIIASVGALRALAEVQAVDDEGAGDSPEGDMYGR